MALLNAFVIVDDQDQAYAELWNQSYHTAKGNYVISGSGVTANGTPPPLTGAGNHAIAAAGSVFTGGAIVTVAGGSVDLSAEYAGLTSGQARFVFVYIDSGGNVQTVAGTPATAGQQYSSLMTALAEDIVILARILLTEGDTTVDTADIKEMRQYAPGGMYSSGNIRISNGGISVYNSVTGFLIDVDGANDFFIKDITGNYSVLTIPNGTGAIHNQRNNGGFYTGVGGELRTYYDGSNSIIHHQNTTNTLFLITDGSAGISLRTGGSVTFQDLDNSNKSFISLSPSLYTFGELFTGTNTTQIMRLQANQWVNPNDYTPYVEWSLQVSAGDAYLSVKAPIDEFSGTGEIYRARGSGSVFGLQFIGGSSIFLANDSSYLYFGGGNDAYLRYDGTNLIINSQVVGSGHVLPSSDSLINLGSSAVRFANGYFDDIVVTNLVDGVDIAAMATFNGSGKAGWVPMSFMGENTQVVDLGIGNMNSYTTKTTNNTNAMWVLNIPYKKDGKSLYVTGFRVAIRAATTFSYISGITIKGVTYNAETILYTDNTAGGTIAMLLEDGGGSGSLAAFGTAIAVSSFNQVSVSITWISGAIGDLDFLAPELEVYYA